MIRAFEQRDGQSQEPERAAERKEAARRRADLDWKVEISYG